jgi:esterase/lipase superfamily enzyme
MKIQRRWLIWGLILFILFAVVALVAGYIGRNFMGIGPIPTRSAFAGRLPGVPEGDRTRFQFFYATNRENSDDTFNLRGNHLGKDLLTGTFDVLISPYIQVAPFIWFDTQSIEWAGRQELAQADFKLKLKQAVDASPHKSLLIVIWGFRDWFQSAALKTAYTGFVLDINTPILLFDWPGNQGEGRQGYFASQEMATQSAPFLGRMIADVVRETEAENIWIMGSSLGCQTISESLAWLSDQPDLFHGKPKLSNVVFSAPDVSAQAFDEKFAERIQKLSQHFTTYVSSNDQALLMSHWINGERRLGRTAEIMVPPEERTGQYEFEEAMELLDLQEKGARNFFVIDVSPINRTRNLHHFFTDSPEFFDDLYQHLLEPDNVVSRRLHSVHTGSRGREYWIIWSY